ncbi:MAG TPA: AraC family transcriptional regulator [Acidimicrobiales bacterium]
MDELVGFLDGPRARGAFLLRMLMSPPWSVRIEDRSPLSLVAVVRGSACIVRDDGEVVRIAPGDIALIRGPEPYLFADDPATPPQVVIHPGQRCTTLDGEDLSESMGLGVRTWGNDPDGGSVVLVGVYEQRTAIGGRLVDALPPQVVVPGEAASERLVGILADEIGRDEPGQATVLDRLLDLLLVGALRAWFSRPDAESPAWYRAYADPVVGQALRLLQHEPARPWTVASLAAELGVSRAALARRFTELVGEPPMTFLTNWRLALAADLLREPGATVGAVAHEVGYGSAFALSTAFKRVRGVTPQAHRRAALAGVGG